MTKEIVVGAIKSLPENQRFMKVIFPWVGFKTFTIEYKREKRDSGQMKLVFKKLLNLAIECIISISIAPLRIFSYIGLFVIVFTVLNGCYILLIYVFFGIKTSGYTSVILSSLFLGNIQQIGIGVLGEYIEKIYIESKKKPSYKIRKKIYQ